MSTVYKFSYFTLKHKELSLYYKQQRVDLGLKGFKILFALVENNGEVVPKNELIKAAWSNQIVTDGALNKQIELIRQALNKHSSDKIFIETKRGIGYQFVANVKNTADKIHSFRKWKSAFLTMGFLTLIIFLYFYPLNRSVNEPLKTAEMPLNIAVIPSAQGQGYINTGGLSYLSTLLDKNPRILSVSPENQWFDREDKKKLSIEIEAQKKLDYVLLVDIQQTKNGHEAHLQLKNSYQFNKKIKLTAVSLKQLFADINTWTRNNLKIEIDSQRNSFNDTLSNDSFALENFFRGLKEKNKLNLTDAIKYFDIAITQDPHFDFARIKKAEAQILANDYHSAQSFLETFENSDELHPNLEPLFLLLKAQLSVYTEKPEQANSLLKQVVSLSEEMQDDFILNKALYLQAVMNFQNGEFNKAIESTLKRQKLLKQTTKNVELNANITNWLSLLYYNTGHYELALGESADAITMYESINSSPGKLESYNLRATILYELAKFEEGYKYLEKAVSIMNQLEYKRIFINVVQAQIYYNFELGHHVKARKLIAELDKLELELKTNAPKTLALGSQLNMELRLKNTSGVKIYYEQYQQIAVKIKHSLPAYYQRMLAMLAQSNLLLENYDLAKAQIDEIEATLTPDQPDVSIVFKQLLAEWLYKTGELEQAQNILNNLLKKGINEKRYRWSLEFAYSLMDIAIFRMDYVQLESLLNQIEFIKPFSYPYLKYKAKLKAHQQNFFDASQLMQKMKNTANQWWNTDDQVLLESYLDQIK